MPATLACTQACLWWWSLARIQFVTMAPLFFCNTAFLAATRTYSPGVSWGNVTGSATTTMISISWSGKTPVIFVACTRKKKTLFTLLVVCKQLITFCVWVSFRKSFFVCKFPVEHEALTEHDIPVHTHEPREEQTTLPNETEIGEKNEI